MSKQLSELDRLFKALADPTRLRILGLLLTGEVCVCHIHESLRIPQPKASRHLAYLRRAGLVDTRRDGLWIHYRLAVSARSGRQDHSTGGGALAPARRGRGEGRRSACRRRPVAACRWLASGRLTPRGNRASRARPGAPVAGPRQRPDVRSSGNRLDGSRAGILRGDGRPVFGSNHPARRRRSRRCPSDPEKSGAPSAALAGRAACPARNR